MYKHILVPVELGDDKAWTAALARAVELVQAFDAKLSLLSVVPDLGVGMVSSFFPPDYADKARETAQDGINKVAAAHVPADLHADTYVAQGKVWREIVRVANETGADLVVMGGRDQDAPETFLLSTTAQRVAQRAGASVLIVR